jgi:hypothetical protein
MCVSYISKDFCSIRPFSTVEVRVELESLSQLVFMEFFPTACNQLKLCFDIYNQR